MKPCPLLRVALAVTLVALPWRVAPTQTPARGSAAPAADTAPPGPAVGQIAPDFALAGASRYGLLRTPVRLSDFRGRTVVIAFFYKARTKG